VTGGAGAGVKENAIQVHTKDKDGNNEDSDFQVIVVCP
jgi:hypothetical protein